MEKCKKLKKKLEQKKELEELDTGNIITTTGRGQRNAFSLYASRGQKAEESSDDQAPQKTSRLKYISQSDSE